MSEKRFKIDTTSEIGHIYINNQEGEHMSWIEVENTLNEQQATIQQLQAQLREKEQEERLYANEILELRETNKEHIKFKSLGGDY